MRLNCWLAVLSFASSCVSAAPTCSQQESARAGLAIEQLRDWKSVSEFRRRYGHCDSSSISEGLSEAVARLLVDQWETLPRLGDLMRADSRLKTFVLRHLDSTLDTEDLETIMRRAQHECPAAMSRFCSELAPATQTALR